LLDNWRLPGSFQSGSALFLYKGQVALQGWDSVQNRVTDLFVPKKHSKQLLLKVPSDGDATSVEPGRVDKQVLAIMRTQHWQRPAPVGSSVSGFSGGSVFDPDTLIDSFSVLIPSRDERIAWISDFSVISYAWDDCSEFHLAVKNAQGVYRDMRYANDIFEALHWDRKRQDQIYLYAINVTLDMAVYGLQIEQRDPAQAVVWIDLRTPNWHVVRTEVGYLARSLVSVTD
jgi:hypothetical protein